MEHEECGSADNTASRNGTGLEPARNTLQHAVVVLPAGLSGRIAERGQRRWLAKSRLRRDESGDEWLRRLLAVLNLPPPDGGLGALRMWGQTGERPAVWIAAADPVYLEARLDHVCMYALSGPELPLTDIRVIFDSLQARLGTNDSNGPYAFARIGALGYLRSDEPIATAAVSPGTAHGASPDIFLPEGLEARGHDRLQSEVQMCLHEADVNLRREQAGLRPVNSLWFWGGGLASPQVARDIPPLYADDPLVRGYWHSSTGQVAPWPGSFDDCLEASPGGFVAVAPETGNRAATDNGTLTNYLTSLRRMVSNGKLKRLTLLFRDGLFAEVRRADRFRFWRRGSVLLSETQRP